MIVRNVAGRHLMDQQALATWLERSAPTVHKHCQHVACDVATHRGLYDADQSADRMAGVPQRRRRATRTGSAR